MSASFSDQNSYIQNISVVSEEKNCAEEILKGIQSTPRILPELLLWDDAGQMFYDTFSQTPTYYPGTQEIEIVNRHASSIAQTLKSGSTLLELGCGTLRKTGTILTACEKQQKKVAYYALDVSRDELVNGLKTLRTGFQGSQFLSINGLHGTYDDGVNWVEEHCQKSQPESICVLWMGNSIANLDPQTVQSLLSGYSKAAAGAPCHFISGIDNEGDPGKILTAYDTRKPALREFIMNGLASANSALGEEAFRDSDWTCTSIFDKAMHQLQVYYEALHGVSIRISGQTFNISRGERILAITSRKLPREHVESLLSDIGFTITNIWWDELAMYGFYMFHELPSSYDKKSNELPFMGLRRFSAANLRSFPQNEQTCVEIQ